MPPPSRHHTLLLLLFLSLSSTMAALPSCSTPLVAFLQRLQSAAVRSFGPDSFDPKLYVDLPLTRDFPTTVSAFDALPQTGAGGSIPVPDLQRFLDAYLGEPEDDLMYYEPGDFVAEPDGFLPGVENPEVRAWALEVHSMWRNLSRRLSERVRERPEWHTLLPLPGPVVVPGSRFREVYYWDTYWIVRGLLASKMYDTAKALVNNLISLLDEYGHVPNGARSYYTNRSQPPLLSSMIVDIYIRTGDLIFLKAALPYLLKEHSFWNTGIHKANIKDAHGHIHEMSRYYAMWNQPRPESATIDEKSAFKLLNDFEKEKFYHEVASTAESGWDFSSRWMRNSSDLTTLSTTSIVPVDLNAYLLKMEQDITFSAKLLGDSSLSKKFSQATKNRLLALNSILWNAEMGQWLDYWIPNNHDDHQLGIHQWDAHNQNKHSYASNFIPIWVESCRSDGGMVKKVVKSLQQSGLIRAAGIATSLSNSGEQWDFPNGWAPLQQMIIEGLAKMGTKEAQALANDIAVRWIKANYAAYKKTGVMHEKYNVETCGEFGGGGEYAPQVGFGWSNGVVLALLEEFGWPKDQKIDC